MSSPDANDDHGVPGGEIAPSRWPMSPDDLLPHERGRWYEQLWSDVCNLRSRYRLPVRAGWWTHPLQVEHSLPCLPG